MAIINFATRESDVPAGAINVKDVSKSWQGYSSEADFKVFTWETHHGLVLSLGELNGYDDSDFYATIWNVEESRPERYVYASTRGWTYPAGAVVDALPEVVAAYEAYQKNLARVARERAALEELMTPAKGKTVEVIKGRKVPLHTTGVVFWVGAGTKYTPNYGYSKHQRVPDRIGIKDAAGVVYWTSADNVQVV